MSDQREDETSENTQTQPQQEEQENNNEGNTLQGLLQRLGSEMTFEELAPHLALTSERIQTTVSSLQSENINEKVMKLHELCDMLTVASEESLSDDAPSPLIQPLVAALAAGETPEIQLLAARAIFNLIEANRDCMNEVLDADAGTHLCSKLLTIEFIDLAEESICVLEKLSRRHGQRLIESGTITATLSYIDFFSITVQRSALRTVANICRVLTTSHLDAVLGNIEQISSFLSHADSKLIQLSCECFERLVNLSRHNPDLLPSVLPQTAVVSLVELIPRVVSENLGGQVHSLVCVILGVAVCSGKQLLLKCVDANLVDVLKLAILDTDGPSERVARTNKEMQELLTLTAQLLPPLPTATAPTTLPTTHNNFAKRRRQQQQQQQTARSRTPVLRRNRPVVACRDHGVVGDKARLLHFGKNMFAAVMQVYSNNINTVVRSQCLQLIRKITWFCEGSLLSSLCSPLTTTAFVCGLLCVRDASVVCDGLKISIRLVQSCPSEFGVAFVRQGLVSHCRQIGLRRDPWKVHSDSRTDTFEFKLSPQQTAKERSSQMACSPDNKPQDRNKFHRHTTTPRNLRKRAIEERHLVGEDHVVDEAKRLAKEVARDMAKAQFDGDGVTLEKLKKIASVLALPPSTETPKALGSLAQLLSDRQGVTVFEFVASRVVPSLFHFLNKHADTDVIERVKLVVDAVGEGETPENLVCLLVRQCVLALSHMEQFALNVQQSASFGVSSLRCLTKPLSLSFSRQEKDESVGLWKGSVHVDPLTPIHLVESFLAPKVRLRKKKKSKNSDKTTPKGQKLSKGEEKKERANPLPQLEEDGMDEATDKEEEEEGEEEEKNGEGCEERIVCGERPVIPKNSDDTNSSNNNSSSLVDLTGFEEGQGEEEEEKAAGEKKCVGQQQQLLLSFHGNRCDPLSSVLGVFHRNHSASSREGQSIEGFWQQTQTIHYRSLSESEQESSSSSQNLNELPTSQEIIFNGTRPINFIIPFSAKTQQHQHTMPAHPTTPLLQFLCLLKSVSENWALVVDSRQRERLVSCEEFVCQRLTDKLIRQLEDPLSLCSQALPQWCDVLPVKYPFLFSFESRAKRLIATSHGPTRALNVFQRSNQASFQNQQRYRNSVEVSRIRRQKVRVERSRVLESAKHVMKVYGSAQNVIEVEFAEETGTGTGPTMEFFSLVATALQERTHKLWVDSNTDATSTDVHVTAPNGLFPAPISKGEGETVVELFRFMGKFIAKGMVDGRLTELALSSVFVRLCLGYRVFPHHLHEVVPCVAKTVDELLALIQCKKEIEGASHSEEEKTKLCQQLTYQGTSVEDLCIPFTLPTNDKYCFVAGGDTKFVSIDNVEQYVDGVVDAYLGAGVARQVDAFREGFSSVFDISALLAFDVGEVETLICGETKPLSFGELRKHTKTDHGFNSDSPSVLALFEVIDEMDATQQRKLVKFITGSPRLPVGGLAHLSPPLTIVRKTPDAGRTADTYLPSVMTCANYVKLPDYSSKQVLLERVLVAISEGQDSFLLS